MEYSRLEPVVVALREYQRLLGERTQAQEMIDGDDAETARARSRRTQLARCPHRASKKQNWRSCCCRKIARDDSNIYLEVRAGTGGDEAAIFAGDLFRMYSRYADNRGWQVEVMSESPGEHGGYKEVISRIVGRGAFSYFKFESGTHRVQRVPATEAQGRIHTSACTVAILPEVAEVEAVDLNPAELRVDTFRASGAGGQHVNKTDSAIRITHMPTGIVVECQDERSQHKNRSRAMSLLKAKLLSAEQEKRDQAEAQSRKLQVGSGDRSERIRTYNFPQGRVTDHRINLTLYKLAERDERRSRRRHSAAAAGISGGAAGADGGVDRAAGSGLGHDRAAEAAMPAVCANPLACAPSESSIESILHRTDRVDSACRLALAQRLLQILDQIVRILDPDRQANQRIVDAERLALLGRNRGMRHQARMIDQALDAAEAFGDRENPQALQEAASLRRARL